MDVYGIAIPTLNWMIKCSETSLLLGAVAQALGLGIESAIRGGLDLQRAVSQRAPTGTYEK